MSKPDVDHHINIKIGEYELAEIDFLKDATYEEIRKYVLDKYGFKVSNLYLAQVKAK
ncbi:hypothetical protein [Peptostreptococcus canis]|uniref:hypothetical protein n=1 Tax=Peptostreptococcus canis TaxID=1159213 RepID=UPI001FAD6406|nr:hypothetical protein [Peptostreptococcus canis]